jgi:uncharacterized protein YjbJ (UPF0337 family)
MVGLHADRVREHPRLAGMKSPRLVTDRHIRPRVSDQEENPMGLKDKAENTGDKLKGKAKETEGRATGDRQRETQGKADQSKSDLKQAGENVKDAFKK